MQTDATNICAETDMENITGQALRKWEACGTMITLQLWEDGG